MSTILDYLTYSLYSLLGLTLIFYMFSLQFPIAGFFARLLASYFCLVAASIWGVFSSIVLRLVGYGGMSQWSVARAFKYFMMFTTSVTFHIDDPHDYLNSVRPAVLIGNHQTELDVLMLAWIWPFFCSVTAKTSLRSYPIFGWFLILSKTIFINRKNSSSAREAMAGAANEMKKHRQSVFMFPEGTRSYYKEPGLLPFKKGAFHLAVQAQVPIVPVVVANYSDVLYIRGLRFNSGTIEIKVLNPIETKGLTAADVEDLTRDTRELMLKEHLELTKRFRKTPVELPPNTARQGQDGVVKASGAEGTVS